MADPITISKTAGGRSAEHYAAQRAPWVPEQLRLIIIAESPPKSGKYFYDVSGSPSEPLFRAVMESIVKVHQPGTKREGLNVKVHQPGTKREGLKRFMDAGCLLLDATYEPVNDRKVKERDDAIRAGLPDLRRRLAEVSPRKDVPLLVLKANVCRLLLPILKSEGYRLLNFDLHPNGIIPFPSTGHQGRFRGLLRGLVIGMGEA